jgi:hypothetical protein
MSPQCKKLLKSVNNSGLVERDLLSCLGARLDFLLFYRKKGPGIK